MEDYIGCLVSLDCGQQGIFQGEVSNVDFERETLSLTHLFENGHLRDGVRVFRCDQIKSLTILRRKHDRDDRDELRRTAAASANYAKQYGGFEGVQVYFTGDSSAPPSHKSDKKRTTSLSIQPSAERLPSEKYTNAFQMDVRDMRKEFDFEANLALFDKDQIFAELDAMTGRNGGTPSGKAASGRGRADESAATPSKWGSDGSSAKPTAKSAVRNAPSFTPVSVESLMKHSASAAKVATHTPTARTISPTAAAAAAHRPTPGTQRPPSSNVISVSRLFANTAASSPAVPSLLNGLSSYNANAPPLFVNFNATDKSFSNHRCMMSDGTLLPCVDTFVVNQILSAAACSENSFTHVGRLVERAGSQMGHFLVNTCMSPFLKQPSASEGAIAILCDRSSCFVQLCAVNLAHQLSCAGAGRLNVHLLAPFVPKLLTTTIDDGEALAWQRTTLTEELRLVAAAGVTLYQSFNDFPKQLRFELLVSAVRCEALPLTSPGSAKRSSERSRRQQAMERSITQWLGAQHRPNSPTGLPPPPLVLLQPPSAATNHLLPSALPASHALYFLLPTADVTAPSSAPLRRFLVDLALPANFLRRFGLHWQRSFAHSVVEIVPSHPSPPHP